MATDACEPQIIRALEKDGWMIEDKPFALRVGDDATAFADFSIYHTSEDHITEVVVVEVKCFPNPQQELQEFYRALGQYQYYRELLILDDNPLPIYLAVPIDAYEQLRRRPGTQTLLTKNQVKLILVDIDAEVVLQWKD